jgi:DNA polymerase-3 subunit epsilon
MVRQIVLDTETTGLELSEGHRIIEIGCVELLHRRPSGRTWHRYLRPEREVEAGALAVHGITNEFLAGQQRFAEIAGEFLEFIAGAELVIHNAPFDVGFLDAELARTEAGRTIAEHCTVLDTLLLARRMHPGQRNSLDALCKRYSVDNSRRDLHGALLDARILADVYLAMSGGQAALSLDSEPAAAGPAREASRRTARGELRIPVIQANAEELAEHEKLLDSIERTTGGPALFRAGGRGNGNR